MVGKTVLKRNEVAKPLHIQRLEAALDLRLFVNQVEKALHSESDNDSEDSDEKSTDNEISKRNRVIRSITKQGTVIITFSDEFLGGFILKKN